MCESSCRPLFAPLLLSLSLHAVLLAVWPAVDAVPALAARRGIEARLVVTPSVRFVSAPAPVVADVVTAAPPLADTGRKRPAARRGSPPADPLAKQGKGTRSVAAHERSPAPPASDAADEAPAVADVLRQYRLTLAIAARRYQSYPELASRQAWQGTANVAVDIGGVGGAPRVVLLRSSGHPVLDAQAVEMLDQAARATAFPEVLKTRARRIVMPVEFRLNDGNDR